MLSRKAGRLELELTWYLEFPLHTPLLCRKEGWKETPLPGLPLFERAHHQEHLPPAAYLRPHGQVEREEVFFKVRDTMGIQ